MPRGIPGMSRSTLSRMAILAARENVAICTQVSLIPDTLDCVRREREIRADGGDHEPTPFLAGLVAVAFSS